MKDTNTTQNTKDGFEEIKKDLRNSYQWAKEDLAKVNKENKKLKAEQARLLELKAKQKRLYELKIKYAQLKAELVRRECKLNKK